MSEKLKLSDWELEGVHSLLTKIFYGLVDMSKLESELLVDFTSEEVKNIFGGLEENRIIETVTIKRCGVFEDGMIGALTQKGIQIRMGSAAEIWQRLKKLNDGEK